MIIDDQRLADAILGLERVIGRVEAGDLSILAPGVEAAHALAHWRMMLGHAQHELMGYALAALKH